jgi:uncharacterized glyoxalase superfamily protein PhnB
MTSNPSVASAPKGIHLHAAVPTFSVDDVAATARWYAEYLGFRIAGTAPAAEPYVYASLERDGVELMLLRCPGDHLSESAAHRPDGVWDAYVRMRGVHAFYETLRGREFIRMPLTRQPYGDWEFEVRDPNGYVLVFSELTA